ncbi:MAG: EamA family transporter [Caldilineaceae bacterium]|nr:EamA family transporter [Caldilineaceae bacterium]
MTLVALALVLTAAVLHATWNLLAKRARGGVLFVWLFSLLSVVVFAPFAAYLIWTGSGFDATGLIYVAGSAIIHLAYFLTLQYGYRAGDLSVVYPLARGSGPLLSTAGAIAWFGERPSWLALGGALLVVIGVFLIAGGGAIMSRRFLSRGVAFGLSTGVLIAAYTLWDKQAVSAAMVPPLLLDFGSSVGRVVLLTPVLWPQRVGLRHEWRTHGREALGVAILSSLAYILVLTAFVTTPVSYVAPAREISILIGALMGAKLLREGSVGRRLVAATMMACGVMALALG